MVDVVDRGTVEVVVVTAGWLEPVDEQAAKTMLASTVTAIAPRLTLIPHRPLRRTGNPSNLAPGCVTCSLVAG